MIAENGTSFHCRVVLIGDPSVGKTCILSQLVDHKFSASEQSTVGANYQIYIEDINGLKIEMQIWDTAGQEKFKSLGPIYYRNALGALIVFDETSRQSFDNLESWIDAFNDVSQNATIFIVANKCDMVNERQVNFSDAEEYARRKNYRAFETSAKTGYGVHELFSELASSIVSSKKSKTVPIPRPMAKDDDSKCPC